MMTRIDYIEHFGCCPVCGFTGLYRNIGDGHFHDHWFYCSEHKLKWCAGSNLIGTWNTWKDETEEFWRENAEYLRDFREIDEHVNDIRKTADWIAGNRAAILNRLVAEDEASAEAEPSVLRQA